MCAFFRSLLFVQSRIKEEHALQENMLSSKEVPRLCHHGLLQTKYSVYSQCCGIKYTMRVCVRVCREDAAIEPHNACRIYGHIYVNKVEGNLHITVGKEETDRPGQLTDHHFLETADASINIWFQGR